MDSNRTQWVIELVKMTCIGGVVGVVMGSVPGGLSDLAGAGFGALFGAFCKIVIFRRS